SEDLSCAAKEVRLVSRSSPGVPGDDDSTTVAFLGRGSAPTSQGCLGGTRYVAFASAAGNLTANPHLPGSTHVYVHDAATGATTLVTKTFDGGAFEPDFSLVQYRAGDTASVSEDGR